MRGRIRRFRMVVWLPHLFLLFSQSRTQALKLTPEADAALRGANTARRDRLLQAFLPIFKNTGRARTRGRGPKKGGRNRGSGSTPYSPAQYYSNFALQTDSTGTYYERVSPKQISTYYERVSPKQISTYRGGGSAVGYVENRYNYPSGKSKSRSKKKSAKYQTSYHYDGYHYPYSSKSSKSKARYRSPKTRCRKGYRNQYRYQDERRKRRRKQRLRRGTGKPGHGYAYRRPSRPTKITDYVYRQGRFQPLHDSSSDSRDFKSAAWDQSRSSRDIAIERYYYFGDRGKGGSGSKQSKRGKTKAKSAKGKGGYYNYDYDYDYGYGYDYDYGYYDDYYYGECEETDSPTTTPFPTFTPLPTITPFPSEEQPTTPEPTTPEPTARPSSEERPTVPPGTPTMSPAMATTMTPTTMGPTMTPTITPNMTPTMTPTKSPTGGPTGTPTMNPTGPPVGTPTKNPTSGPTQTPTGGPTAPPTSGMPTVTPTQMPTGPPQVMPTMAPSSSTMAPTGALEVIVPFQLMYIDATNPSDADLATIEALTMRFLEEVFLLMYDFDPSTTMESFGLTLETHVDENGVVTVDYVANVLFGENSAVVPTMEEVEAIIAGAFEGINKEVYLDLVQNVGSNNAFSSTTDVMYMPRMVGRKRSYSKDVGVAERYQLSAKEFIGVVGAGVVVMLGVAIMYYDNQRRRADRQRKVALTI